MKVFESLDKQHADLYRWIRKKIDFRFFHRLTGSETAERMTELEIDRAILEVFQREQAYDAAHNIHHRSKIRSGLLPPSLGGALLVYTNTVRQATIFEEGLGGLTQNDMNIKLKKATEDLLEEIARLR